MTFSGVLIVYWLKEKLGTIMYYPRENIAMFGTGRNCLSSGKVGQNGPLSKSQLGQQELLIHKKSSSNIHLQYNIPPPHSSLKQLLLRIKEQSCIVHP